MSARRLSQDPIINTCNFAEWNDSKANLLRGMLEASIQRRFPQGLKVHVRELQDGSCLTELAQRLRAANLSITRAKVLLSCQLACPFLTMLGSISGAFH